MKLRTTVVLLAIVSTDGSDGSLERRTCPPNPKPTSFLFTPTFTPAWRVHLRFTPSSARRPWPFAMAASQAVGRNDEILKLKGPATEVVDLGGHFVMPGFNDAHLHLANAGFQRLTVDLVGVKSLTEFRERIRARVETAAPGEWIIGGGWDQTLWPVQGTSQPLGHR